MSSEILAALQKETEQTKKAIENYENSDKRNNYWSAPTMAMKAIAQYGAENIFLTNEVYHGLYHDDYAKFEYYNNVTGETFRDEWTTAFCCPAYDSYKCLPIAEAWEHGLVNKARFLDMRRKGWLNSLAGDSLPRLSLAEMIDSKALIEVKNGRKWQGKGYVVSYRNMTFGYKNVTYAAVLDPTTSVINEVNAEYLGIAGHAELVAEWKKELRERIEGLTEADILDDGSLQQALRFSFPEWMKEKGESVSIDLKNASYPAQEERDRKQAAFKEKKMAELVVWVQTNTDKKGDEIQALAERIFARRYA